MDHIEEQLNNVRAHVYQSLQVTDEMVSRLHDRVFQALPQSSQEVKRGKKFAVVTVATTIAASAAFFIWQEIPQVRQPAANQSDVRQPEVNQPGSERKNPSVVQPNETQDEKMPEYFLADKTEREKLLLMQTLPLDISYEELKAKVPELGNLQPEAGMEGRVDQLTEAFARTDIFDHTAKIEFNFDQNKLYSSFYLVEGLQKEQADQLYKQLTDFYTRELGVQGSEEADTERPSQSHVTTMWIQKGFTVVVTQNASIGQNSLSWGYQKPAMQ